MGRQTCNAFVLPLLLCGCAGVARNSIPLTESARRELASHYTVEDVFLRSERNGVCIFETSAKSKEWRNLLLVTTSDNGCSAFHSPYVAVDATKQETVDFVVSILFGSRRQEFVNVLRGNGAKPLGDAIEKGELNGLVFNWESDPLSFSTSQDGMNYEIEFLGDAPMKIRVGRWQ